MKKLKKFLVLFFLIGICSIFCISNVKASLMNERLTAILTGTGKDPNGDDDEPVLNGVFDGNYILMCKYSYSKSSGGMSTTNYYDSTVNIYYSLKEGQRKFVLIRLYDEEDVEIDGGGVTSFSKINHAALGTDKTLTGGKSGVKLADFGFFESMSGGPTRFDVKIGNHELMTYSPNEKAIMEQLINGECPSKYTITAWYELETVLGFIPSGYTKNYSDCIGSGCPSPNEGDPTPYKKSTNYVKNGLRQALVDAKEEIGYSYGQDGNFETLRTVNKDANGNVTGHTANNKVSGKYYKKFAQLQSKRCDYGTDTTARNKIIDECTKEFRNIYIKNVKLNVITSKNGTDVTTIDLPKAITNCNNKGEGKDCISNKVNTFQTDLGSMSNLCRYIAERASKDCVDKLEGTMSANPTEENIENYESANHAQNQNSASLVEYIQATFIDEKQQTRGCNVFGEKTTDLLKKIYNLLKIGAPLLVVVMGILDFVKSLLAGDDKGFNEAWQRFLKRLISAVIILLLPVLIMFVLNLSGVLKQYGIEGEGTDIYCIFK